MRRHRPTSRLSLLRVATIPVAALVLASCQSDPPEPGPPHTEDGLTAPGTALDLGETATVHIDDATVELTIASITRGDGAGLERIGYDEAATTTAYYVDYTARVIEGTTAGGIRVGDHLQATGGGQPAPVLVIAEPFPECQDRNVPPQSSANTSVEACLTFITDKGAPAMDAIAFSNRDDYDVTKDGQVTWQ